LCFALAHLCGLAFCENITHIHQPLGLHRKASALNRYFDEIAFLKLQGLEDPLRNYNLAPLTNATYRCRLC